MGSETRPNSEFRQPKSEGFSLKSYRLFRNYTFGFEFGSHTYLFKHTKKWGENNSKKLLGRVIHNHHAIHYAKSFAIITTFNSIYKVTPSLL